MANTAVNRRFTFGIRGRAHAARHQLRGLIAFGIGLAVTSGALAALHAVTAQPGRAAEVAVLVAANLAATVVRFVLYRGWVFRGATAALARRPSPPRAAPETPDSSSPAGLSEQELPVTAISTAARRRSRHAGGPAGGRAARLLRGRPDDPAWARPALLALLAGHRRCSTWPA